MKTLKTPIPPELALLMILVIFVMNARAKYCLVCDTMTCRSLFAEHIDDITNDTDKYIENIATIMDGSTHGPNHV